MSGFLSFLSTYSQGVYVFIASLAALIFFTQWLAWIFSFGRFSSAHRADAASERTSSIRFVLTDLLVKIIDDFRHLLALIVVLIFAVVIGCSLLLADKDTDGVTKALQGVVATLGGLIGSIIGYYFGESTAQRSIASQTTQQAPSEGEEEVVERSIEPIQPIVPPDNPDEEGK